MTVLSPHASEETKFNGKIGQLKASKPLIQEFIPGLKRKSDKEYCGPCPHCKDGENRFIVFTDKQTYWCRQCNTKGDILNYIELTTGKNIKEQLAEAGLLASKRRPLNSKQNLPAHIWSQSKSGAEAAATIRKAFAFRSIQLEQIPPNIRLNSYKGKLSIACVMQSPLDENPPAKPQCVHLTLLDEEGKKKKRSETSPSTKYHGPKTGLAVMLPGKDSSSLVIGEGLETTLSAMQAMGFSGMVCGDAGNMADMAKLREQFQQIFILADSDKSLTGQRDALKAAESIGKANPQAAVWLVAPDDSCFTDAPVELDFNDLLMKDTSGGSIRARFERKQRLDEIGWRPKEKEQPDETAEPEKIKPVEVWSFADVEKLLEQDQEKLKELTTVQKHELAEEILLHNSFRSAEINAVSDMLKKQLGIAKGQQDKILKAARKEKKYEDESCFLVEEGSKGELRLIAQSRAAQKISEMTCGKFMYAPDIQHWHHFTGTHWANDSKNDKFGSHLVTSLEKGAGPIGFSAGYMEGVETIMVRSGRNKPEKEENATKSQRVPFMNGILDPETKEFQETTPENALRWCLPYEYDPDAECEGFQYWLDIVCDDETGGLQKLIRAMINVCLMERPDLQYFIHLQGEPGTGKGTLARLLKEIVGPQGFWKSSIDLLENDKFEPANYYQKRLLQFDEVPAHVKKIQKFLELTGRDPVRYEEKNKQANQHFTYTGLVLMLGNSMFSTDDQTTFAIERRRRTIQFNKELSESDRREFADDDGEALLHKQIPGIINWALEMTPEEVSEVFYNPPVKVVEANQEAEEVGFPVVKFITEHVQYEPAGKVYPGVKREYSEMIGSHGLRESRKQFEGQEDKLYPRYLAWCLREDKKPLARRRALETILRAINKKLVPEGGAKVETGVPDRAGTPVLGISLIPWEETEFSG